MPTHRTVNQDLDAIAAEYNGYLIDNDIDNILSYYTMEHIDLLCHTNLLASDINMWIEERDYLSKVEWLSIVASRRSWGNRTFDESTALYNTYTNNLPIYDM